MLRPRQSFPFPALGGNLITSSWRSQREREWATLFPPASLLHDSECGHLIWPFVNPVSLRVFGSVRPPQTRGWACGTLSATRAKPLESSSFLFFGLGWMTKAWVILWKEEEQQGTPSYGSLMWIHASVQVWSSALVFDDEFGVMGNGFAGVFLLWILLLSYLLMWKLVR